MTNKILNLGCGLRQFEDAVNVDIVPFVQPDKIVDLNETYWDFNDNEFNAIIAYDILEHLDDTILAIKEMYRISSDGAIWEIRCPYAFSEESIMDLTHKKLLAPTSFGMFDQISNLKSLKEGKPDSALGLSNSIDIEIQSIDFIFSDKWKNKFQQLHSNRDDIIDAITTYNNVANSFVILLKVHKPGRVSMEEFMEVVNERLKNKPRLNNPTQ